MNPDQVTILQETLLPALQHPCEGENVNKWLFEIIRPYLKGRILEIGSGNGAISSLFVENEIGIHLSDSDNRYIETLQEKYKENSIVRGIHNVDFHHPNFGEAYADMIGVFNTVFKLVGSRHTPVDSKTIANAKLLLRERGHLIVLAPVYTSHYNGLIEEELRDYNRVSVNHLLGSGVWKPKTMYFNLPSTTDPKDFIQSGLSVILITRKI